MTLTLDDLWSQVLWSPAESHPHLVFEVGPPKVSYFKMTLAEQDVFRFDVSVDDRRVLLVQVVHRFEHIVSKLMTPAYLSASLFIVPADRLQPRVQMPLGLAWPTSSASSRTK